MKRWIALAGILCMLLIAGMASGAAVEDKNTALRPVTHDNLINPTPPLPPFGNQPGTVIDDKIYAALAPCYSENLIKAYGPVPVFTKDHQVVSRGIIADYTAVERDAWFKKLDGLYESSKGSFDNQYAYPQGPVVSYGYDAVGSVAIGIYEKDVIDQNTLDEMYSFIASESKKKGMENVPVIFFAEPVPQLDLSRTDIWRPVIGGVQTGTPAGSLTVGFAATRGTTSGFVTSGHGGGVGTTVFQPNPSYPIATITVSSLGTSSDSSYVTYSNNAGQIFESSQSQPWIYGWTDPSVGLGVIMSGDISGLTTGSVTKKGSAYNSYFLKMIDNQWFATYSATGGDSGAPVYYKDANQHIQLVGVHWAHTTSSIFSPISGVLSDLS